MAHLTFFFADANILQDKLSALETVMGKGKGRSNRKKTPSVAATASKPKGKRGNPRKNAVQEKPKDDSDEDTLEYRLRNSKKGTSGGRRGGRNSAAGNLWVDKLFAQLDSGRAFAEQAAILNQETAGKRRGRKRRTEPEVIDLIKSPPLILPGSVSMNFQNCHDLILFIFNRWT